MTSFVSCPCSAPGLIYCHSEHSPNIHRSRSSSLRLPVVKAHTVLAQQDYELASRFLERALAQDPRNVEARELLGVCDLELGNVQEARDVSHHSRSESDGNTPLMPRFLSCSCSRCPRLLLIVPFTRCRHVLR